MNLTFCIGRSRSWFRAEYLRTTDGYEVIRLPKYRWLAAKIVSDYDFVISIEATVDYLFSLKRYLKKKILFWIQDPRPAEDWSEIATVNLAQETSYWNDKTYRLVNESYKQGLVIFCTQARYLASKAIRLYNLPENIDIPFLPNPLVVPEQFITKENSKDVIFLGRLDSVKRGWLFCEIAKRMPQYDFFVMGASTSTSEAKRNKILSQYHNLPNLHFLGHCDGEKKDFYLRKAKILVNTSIHEALPVSFLEAMGYGVTVISNQNPDGLVSKFGGYVGHSVGDGWDDVDKFVEQIDTFMNNEQQRSTLALQAYHYVQREHGIKNFKKQLQECLKMCS